jgi:hypothetical protein
MNCESLYLRQGLVGRTRFSVPVAEGDERSWRASREQVGESYLRWLFGEERLSQRFQFFETFTIPSLIAAAEAAP